MSPAQPKQSFLDILFLTLTEARDAAMRVRKASVQSEYMVARRLVEETYSGFSPEDLPVDLQRVKRDLAVTRDQLADRACDEIDGSFKLAIGFIRATADRFPKVYEQVMTEIVDPKAPKKARAPKSAAPGVVRVLPDWVGKTLSADRISAVVERLAGSGGASMNELFELSKANTDETRAAVRKFVNYLMSLGHVLLSGKTRGVKYSGGSSLKVLQTRLSAEATAESER